MKAAEQAESLISRGYTEVERSGLVSVGSRVRHVGEQYTRALRGGTATVERIFQRTRGDVVLDVELIVKRDEPKFGPDDTHGFWANYHTLVIESAA